MQTTRLDREIEQRLHDHGVRYTRGRRAVVTALRQNDGPLSAAELHRETGAEIPISSLYRTLAVLAEAGVTVPHLGTKGLTRYELAEWIIGHHHHLVCIDCGAVDDIDVPQTYENQVRQLVDDIGSMASFAATGHALEIEGRCARCA